MTTRKFRQDFHPFSSLGSSSSLVIAGGTIFEGITLETGGWLRDKYGAGCPTLTQCHTNIGGATTETPESDI